MFKDSIVYLLGEVLVKLIPFALLPYLTRKLGVDGFGELSFYQSCLAFFIVFIGLSQHGAVARYYYFYGHRSINLIVTSGYLINFFLGLLLIVVFLFYGSEIMVYVVLIAIFQNFVNVQLSLRQCQKQAINYFLIQIFLSALNLTLTVFFLEIFDTQLVEKRLLAMLLSLTITFVMFYMFFLRNQHNKNIFSLRYYLIGVRYILVFGVPLFLHQFNSVARVQVDKILVLNLFSAQQLGVYSAGFQIASIFLVLVMALNKAIVPYYYEALKKKIVTKDMVVKYFFISLIFVPIPAFFAWTLPANFYQFFLGDGFGFSKYFTVFFLIGFSMAIPYLILVNPLFYFGKNFSISMISVLSTILYVALVLLLSNFGVEWLPISNVIAELSTLLFLYFYVKSKRIDF